MNKQLDRKFLENLPEPLYLIYNDVKYYIHMIDYINNGFLISRKNDIPVFCDDVSEATIIDANNSRYNGANCYLNMRFVNSALAAHPILIHEIESPSEEQLRIAINSNPLVILDYLNPPKTLVQFALLRYIDKMDEIDFRYDDDFQSLVNRLIKC